MRIVSFIIFLIPGIILGQDAISLDQAQQFALDNNRTLQASHLNIAKAKEIVKETYAIGLPQINASAEYNNFLDIPVSVLPDFISPTVYGVLIQEDLIDAAQFPSDPNFVEASFGTSNTLNAGATLSQLLFDGSYLVGLQATKVYLGISEIQAEISEKDIKKNVAESYYNVLIAQENVKILDESKTTIEKTITEVRAMFNEGLMAEDDVDQLQLTLIGIENNLNNAKRQIDLTKQLLKMQLGMELTAPLELSDNLEALLNAKILASNETTFSIGKLPEFKLLENNIRANQLTVKNSKAKYLPSLSGFFSYSQSGQRNEFNFFDSNESWFATTLWGMKLSVPVFSSGMKHAKVNQAKLDLESAILSKKDEEQGLTIAAQKSKSDFDFANENHRAQKLSYELSGKIRNKTLIKYKEGLASSFQLNQIETQYLEAQGAYLMSILTLLNSKAAFDRAYGN
ncbi:MAG: outer membrane protein [Patiriisocius sp.]|jgi:outer membrane protein